MQAHTHVTYTHTTYTILHGFKTTDKASGSPHGQEILWLKKKNGGIV